MAEWEGGLFALPPGVDFAREFVAGFLRRMFGQPPEAIARVTIYVNSTRTMISVRDAFDRHGPLLLPKFRAVTDLGAGPEVGQGRLAPPMARQFQLATLIDRMLQQRPDLAAGHSVPVLARSLADLMTEMQVEGLGPKALEAIDTGDHARHWQNSLAFLRIAAQFHLTGEKQDRAARQRAAAGAAASDWADGRNFPNDPVIVVGSTGSHGATRLFMQAVAALPNGAVVLPGFDWDLPQPVWDTLDDTIQDHPQARFAPLIRAEGFPERWTDCRPPVPLRNKLVSLALRPAPVTDQWIAEGPQLPDLAGSCEGLTLIEADQPGAEAEVIALIMRKAAEQTGPVTLISADRGLVRQVIAALDRWGLRPDDSLGQPLHLTAPGLLLSHIAALFGQKLTIDRLLILLKHPLTATGSAQLDTPDARHFARELELSLRKKGPVFPDSKAVLDWASRGDKPRVIWAEWLAGILDRIAWFETDHAPRPLPDRLTDLRGLAEALAAGPGGCAADSQLWAQRPGRMVRAVLDQLQAHAAEGPALTPGDLAALLTGEMRTLSLRDNTDTHPQLRIRGTRETRTEGHGTVILSGLNEGQWPLSLNPDPWLSRQMRLQAGLNPPERQIGLAVHDFQQGIAAEKVFLTRAGRNAEAETIPSRWLNRLTNLLAGLPEGPQALAGMRRRGADWLAQAAALSRHTTATGPARRPSPVPPAPPFRELPVTDISLLIRDPYGIYAKRVLRLRPLNPLRAEPDAALRGQALHSIVEQLLRTGPTAETPPEKLRSDLLSIAAEVLAQEVPWPSARAFWMARIRKFAGQIVTDELARLAQGRPQVIESRGKIALTGMDFRLTARPDRIDLLNDGQVMIYDYKSGTPPTNAQIEHFDKQLILEAAMARRGGFDGLGPVDVAGIRYIRLGGDGRTYERDYSQEMELRNWNGFLRLIRAYLTGEAGFTAMRAPELTSYAGDYCHLARYGEWSLTDPAQPVKVGDHG